MREINETFALFGERVLWLGRAGERQAVRVCIDLTDELEAYPNAAAVLKIRSPTGKTAYPAATTLDGGKLYWVVDAADTAQAGMGEAQLSLMEGDAVVKTAVAITNIGRSLCEGGQAPDPVQSWMEAAEATRKQAEEAGERALKAAERAEAAAGLGADIEIITAEELEEILK